MVELMLEDPAHESLGLHRDLIAVEVVAREMDLIGPHDLEVQVGNRQATLLVDELTSGFDDHRVDNRPGALAVTQVVDEQALLHTDLRGGKAHAGSVVHRGDHVMDESHQLCVHLVDLMGMLAQNRVADKANRIGSHATRVASGPRALLPHHPARRPVPAPDHSPRVAAVNAGQYFESEPSSPSRRHTVPLALPDLSLALTTDRGVFARDGVDPGTKLLLLEGPAPATSGDLLDLGCGYGPIALTLARRAPEATVWALDVNRRALELTALNAAACELSNVRAVAGEDVPHDVRFVEIWSNPPIRIGKAALQSLLVTWLDRLAPNGRALLVIHKHLGADSLARWLNDQGYATERLTSRMGYRLIEVHPRPGDATTKEASA